MKYQENIEDLTQIGVDWMGLIFYPPSPRYVRHALNLANKEMKKIGVFVNAPDEFIEKRIEKYDLAGIQFHGNEKPEQCQRFKEKQLIIIKAFSIDEDFDFAQTIPYAKVCDYFLFDTKGKLPGGTGQTFSWDLLDKYEGATPFLVSGGISLSHLNALKKINHQHYAGVDLNSRFESRPGMKKIKALKRFKNEYFS